MIAISSDVLDRTAVTTRLWGEGTEGWEVISDKKILWVK